METLYDSPSISNYIPLIFGSVLGLIFFWNWFIFVSRIDT